MRALNYEDQALKWQPDNIRAQRFVVINIVVFVVVLSAGLFLSSIELPKEERMTYVAVPERVAKFILENETSKPRVSEETIPKPKLAAKLEPKVKREPIPKPKAPLKSENTEDRVKQGDRLDTAREKAENSGLLALSHELSDLMDTSDVEAMLGGRIGRTSDPAALAKIDTGILDVARDEAASAVVTVKGEDFSSAIGSTKLGAQKRVVMNQAVTAEKMGAGALEEQEGQERKKKSTFTPARSGNFRTDEDIAYVMDRNKGKLYSVYRQARRINPGLKGRIVFDITILPSGKVSRAVIRSSELDNAKLESRLLARVKGFDFGEREGDSITVTYPVEFLPS